jgi:hypothetical protein
VAGQPSVANEPSPGKLYTIVWKTQRLTLYEKSTLFYLILAFSPSFIDFEVFGAEAQNVVSIPCMNLRYVVIQKSIQYIIPIEFCISRSISRHFSDVTFLRRVSFAAP